MRACKHGKSQGVKQSLGAFNIIPLTGRVHTEA